MNPHDAIVLSDAALDAFAALALSILEREAVSTPDKVEREEKETE